jgi:hypothetical protein
MVWQCPVGPFELSGCAYLGDATELSEGEVSHYPTSGGHHLRITDARDEKMLSSTGRYFQESRGDRPFSLARTTMLQKLSQE